MFDPASRYAGLTPKVFGDRARYVGRRAIPATASRNFAQYTVTQGDRLDTIAAQMVGDPTQFWRICDANPVLRPTDLTATPGRSLRIASGY